MLSNTARNNGKGEPRVSARAVLVLAAGTWLLLPGCQLMVRPFHDEFVVHPVSSTTASVDGIRAADTHPVIRERGHAQTLRRSEDGTVTHGPLYFEDPYEGTGSDDGQFAWTGEDYFQIPYWRARFLLNAIAFPVSAVVTPPWTVMESDGRLSRRAWGEDHDAQRCVDRPVKNTSEDATVGESPSAGG